MYQFTHLHLAISDKLGWGDMLAEITLPAIQVIINNYNRIRKEFIIPIQELGIEDPEIAEDLICFPTIDKSLATEDSDEIFLYLYAQCYHDTVQFDMVYDFISIRGEIEEYMRRGYNYQEAIAEWFK